MINWKNLRCNPPQENCNLCVKIGLNYETYMFRLLSATNWDLYKYPKTISQEELPDYAMYINLDEII